MNSIKNFIADIPIRIGSVMVTISNVVIGLGVWLHVMFGTEDGQKFEEIDKMLKEFKTIIKDGDSATKSTNNESNRLNNMIKGSGNGKKSTFH